MRIRTFVLGVMLVSLVGWCTVRESMRQIQYRYKLAELKNRENALRGELEKMRTREEFLVGPGRLDKLNEDKNLGLVALPPQAEPRGRRMADGSRVVSGGGAPFERSERVMLGANRRRQ